jgi:NADH-quinone oxidoreductase subunit N
LLNSAAGAYYYLRILVEMFMHEPGEGASSVKPLTPSMLLALLLPAAGTLFLGIFPSSLLEFASRSAAMVK